MAQKKRALVVFPGRGSYAAGELGYLTRHHAGRLAAIKRWDQCRSRNGAEPVLELDALPKFSLSRHLPGRNASNLIYSGALSDFAAIDREQYDVVAVCGNSLGWYLALAGAGALSLENGAHLVDTMGGLMEREGVGGQLLCSISLDDWTADQSQRRNALDMVQATPNAFLSIDLGGTLVLAGDDAALKSMQSHLKNPDGSPLIQLPKHAAFHTPLLKEVAAKARGILNADLFQQPEIPLVDGRGVIWSPDASDIGALHDYTLNHQITETYDFARTIEVGLKEFAPDCVILAGPGSTLGAPIGQCLIAHRWQGIETRSSFAKMQADAPFLLAMGRSEQRAMTV